MTRPCPHALRAPLLLLALALAAPLAAQEVVFYRCTDASGAVTLQNGTPCAKGSKQEKRVIQGAPTGSLPGAAPVATPAPAPSPAPVAAPAPARTPTPAVAATPAATVADEDRLPPPALFECRTYDNGRYLSDDGQPPPRCAPVAVTGLDGTSNTAAGSACQMVTDQCQRIPDGALCTNWKQRLREAQSQLRFGTPAQRDSAQADVERMQRIVRDSSCAN